MNKLFGYNKKIDNADILVYYYVGGNGLELHFVDLLQIEKTGVDANTNNNSTNIFAYVISVLFKQLDKGYAISIVAPPKNNRRLEFYLKVIKYIINKHNLNLIPVVKENVIMFQPLVIKEGINPYLLV